MTRMKPDRTSIVVIVVMQTGALNDDDTDDSKVFSKDDMGSEDLYPGRTICLFPSSFNHFLQSHENKKKKNWQQPVIDLTILFLTLPLGVDSNTIFISQILAQITEITAALDD